MTDYAARRTMMVDTQVRTSDVTRYPILQAMLTIPREEFVPRAKRAVAYAGDHVALGHERYLLDPRVFAKMIDGLEIGPADLVLDLGCGLGYSAAVIAHMAEAVVALEEAGELATEAAEILAAQGADNAVVAEGTLAEGDPGHGPYDVIMVEGGVEEIPPALIEQLKTGGRMAAVFMEGRAGRARLGYRTASGAMAWRYAFDATAPVLPGFARAPAFRF